MELKRGQVEVVAVVIGVAILTLLYLIFVPLPKKCEFLPSMPECKSQALVKETLFEAKPGFLKQQLEHAYYSLKPVELFTKEEVDIATLLEGVRTERTLFGNNIQTGIFRIYGKCEGVNLFINIKEAKGSLKVSVNGDQIAVLSGDGTKAVKVPLSDLNYDENVLVLESSNPLLPWTTNYHFIDKVLVKEVYTVFRTMQTQYVNVEENLTDVSSAKLSFWADCISKENLIITLNNAKISDEYSCGLKSMDVRLAKNNTFVFKSNGDYFVHDLKLDLKFKANDYPTYYFDLSSDNYASISSGKKSTVLKIQFDSTQQKKFDLYINNNLIVKADSSKIEWSADIDKWLREGQNSIKILPRTDVNILDMKAELG